MRKKIIEYFVVSIMVIALLAVPATTNQARSVESMTMFQASKFDAHYRVPNTGGVERILQAERVILPEDSSGGTDDAVQTFMEEFIKRNPTTPNPEKFKALMSGEKGGYDPGMAETPIKSLAVPVEFPNEDTFDHCGETVTTSGPLHNEIAPPGPRDNNTIWYEDTTPELYDELYFGTGPDAGVIVNHPNLGLVDLRGNTMANYYLEQSDGLFMPAGEIYPGWLQAAYSEGWYGADGCDGGSHNIRAHELVEETVDLVNADDPEFPWQNFDGDGDGFVDNYTVIHAGMGQEAGGGAQGTFAIWSHASAIDYPTGKLACSAGSAGCPDRDIFVREYSMDPENIDIGVIAEEFGHAAFGLPDIYTTDYQNSVANWAIMSAGSWNGILGGMQPAPFPLWFRYVIGWADIAEMDYTDEGMFKVGQLSRRLNKTLEGLKINLPDQELTTPNPLDTGNAWWSDLGDYMENTLAHELDLTGTTAPIFSFNSYWSIEDDWDYGYVEASPDGGATWALLYDMDGVFVDTNPNGNNDGWGLTGEGMGILRFDLSPWAGQTVWVRLRYSTDAAVQYDGWWADDFSLDDDGTNLWFDDIEGDLSSWMTDTWVVVPVTNIYPRYYLVEWRNLSGFDEGLVYPYQTVYSSETEWEVDRAPYSVPGMLVWYRDTSYLFDYTLSNSWYDPPSWGPKHALIVIDSHPFPYGWDTFFYSSGAPLQISGRVQTADATFTLGDTTPFTLRLGYDPYTGEYVDTPLETKTFGPREGERQFHDSVGYYPGILFSNGGLYWWDIDASAVVPAMGDYTTKITDLNYDPFYGLYGYDLGGTFLGSGNPGDDAVQFGLHLAVSKQAEDGSWGMIQVWNSEQLVDLEKEVIRKSDDLLVYILRVTNMTPENQDFVLHDAIPEYTTIRRGYYYDADMDAIHWEGSLFPGQMLWTAYSVTIDPDVPAGTLITNEAVLTDDAVGDTASVTVER
jgi:immune inhibitor A